MLVLKSKGAISSAILVAISLTALGWVSYSFVPAYPRSLALRTTDAPQARHFLGMLGLECEALAAAGLNVADAERVLADLQAHLNDNGVELLAAVSQHNVAKKQVDADRRMTRAGKGPSSEELASRAATLDTSAANRESRQAAALLAATEHITEEQRNKLASIAANTRREVPAVYRLVNRTDEQWSSLRDALSSERQAQERGESPIPAVSSLLANVRSEEVTAAAIAASTSSLASLQQALP